MVLSRDYYCATMLKFERSKGGGRGQQRRLRGGNGEVGGGLAERKGEIWKARVKNKTVWVDSDRKYLWS